MPTLRFTIYAILNSLNSASHSTTTTITIPDRLGNTNSLSARTIYIDFFYDQTGGIVVLKA